MNTFYHSDCLVVMRHDIEPETVDLIYLDPPFFTGKVQKGKMRWQPGAMEVSYEDSRRFWSEKASEMREKSPAWLRHIATNRPDFASYLWYMMERLQACYKVLSLTGSIYLHCDWRASHYLKMIMDEVFGFGNFRNEIIWHYASMSRASNDFPKKHDIIFRYSKSNNYLFNRKDILIPYAQTTIDRAKYGGAGFTRRDGKANYLIRNGKIADTVWDIPHLKGKESIGYPTQKPLALLERIIKASSNEGDIVLDPFCGCGTAILSAHEHNRRWVGIDINNEAWKVILDRANQPSFYQWLNLFKEANYIPRDLDEVMALNPKQFEGWVNEYYKATKPYPDGGVDGITQAGVGIQVKSFVIKYDVISKFITDAKYHPNTSKPLKTVMAVSQVGFDGGARKRKFEIEAAEGVEIILTTPKEMLRAVMELI